MELLATGARSEAALAVVVLGALVVAAALLSYFVVAPEYEKRLSQQYAALQRRRQQYVLLQRRRARQQAPRRARSPDDWDIEAGSSSEGDGDDERALASAVDAARSASAPRRAVKMHKSIGPGTLASAAIRHARSAAGLSRERVGGSGRLARRRKSESDALKEANLARAAMLRRRVLLRKLEEEIEGAKQANEAQWAGLQAPAAGSASASVLASRRMSSGDALVWSRERLQTLRAHPAGCDEELATLAAARTRLQQQQQQQLQQQQQQEQQGEREGEGVAVGVEVKEALRTVHDMLALHLSVDHRDMNKVTVLCNALLRHDGLNHLRALEAAGDADVRALATAIFEKAVPAIWH